jgi:hypothetical protein
MTASMCSSVFSSVTIENSSFGPKQLILWIRDGCGARFSEKLSDFGPHTFTECVVIMLQSDLSNMTTVVGEYENEDGMLQTSRINVMDGVVPFRALCWVFADAEPVYIDS